jgi:hypothetical protein
MGNPMKSVSKEAVRKATLEAVAIAIGVFAALYADNWNEEQKISSLHASSWMA